MWSALTAYFENTNHRNMRTRGSPWPTTLGPCKAGIGHPDTKAPERAFAERHKARQLDGSKAASGAQFRESPFECGPICWPAILQAEERAAPDAPRRR